MSKPKVAFAQLRHWLLELGFQERVVAEGHISFRHAASDTTILLPRYEAEELVAPHHLVSVRVLLDGKGVMDAEAFDQRVGEATAKRTASVSG